MKRSFYHILIIGLFSSTHVSSAQAAMSYPGIIRLHYCAKLQAALDAAEAALNACEAKRCTLPPNLCRQLPDYPCQAETLAYYEALAARNGSGCVKVDRNPLLMQTEELDSL